MAVYLIRHPEPEVAAGLCYGSTDLPLRADPAALAVDLRTRLPGHFRLYSSPLQRCLLLAQGLPGPVTVDTRLAELHFGRWELCAWDALGPTTLDAWIASGYAADAHGGESMASLQARVLDWFVGLDPHADTVAVTHAGVIRTLLAHVHGWRLADCLRLPLAFGGVTCLQHPPRNRA